jgi:hypothetical protein
MIEWRIIPEFPCYEVSEDGLVRRAKPGIRGGQVGKLMKPYIREDGYRMYILRASNRSFHRKAHQLVALAFIGPPPFPRAEVCHNDGTRTNDHYKNLRWGTRQSNADDMVAHGQSNAGVKHPLAKLTEEQVREVRTLRKAGVRQRVIAEKLGVAQTTISKIDRGIRWASV